jgi:16S rRNA (adenine1518-N6/adenine1519-N6)-dimethyltransferase
VSLRRELQADLADAGVPPLHRFGQHFMVDEAALQALVEALGPLDGVRVAEIGPGTGLLTRRLLAAGAQVLAVEIDRGLCAFLERRLVPLGLALVSGDCLAGKSRLHPALEAFAGQPWRLGANLPYEVSLPVLLNAVALPLPPERIAVTIQYEAAQRLCSEPGADAWGASAATLQAAGRPRLVRRLPPGCFMPPPRVESAILAWEPAQALPAGFGAWCRRLFSARRKVLPGALRDAGMTRDWAEACCRACGLDTARRVENLAPPELLALHAACLRADPDLPTPGPSS